MDFGLTEEQRGLRQMARDFADKEIVPIAAEFDEREEFPYDLVRKMADYGLQSLNVPEECGGAGLDTLSTAIVLEELARGCAGVGVISLATALAVYPFLLGATPEQQKRFLTPIGEGGGLAAFCLSEPNAGSDVASMATIAERVPGGYRLNGTKRFISNGGVADTFAIFATVDKGKRHKGITAFALSKGTPGLSAPKKEKKMGIRASDTSDVVVENAFVPEGDRLGEEGEGFAIAMKTLDLSRPGIGALSVGLAQGAMEAATRFSRERLQFGKPIGEHQQIQAMLADMAMEIEAARLLVYEACWRKEADLSFSTESAMAKCFASDIAMRATTNAVQIFGGYGYSREYPVEKYMRDAKIMQIFEGTNQIQRLVIARDMIRG